MRLPLALCVALMGAACGGGGDGPTHTPSVSSASQTPSSPAPTAPAVVGTFRACHKLHDDALVLVLRFQNRDPSLIGGYEGAIRFETTPVDPATWSTTGEPVVVAPLRDSAFYEQHRRVIVPPGEPVPSAITLSVTTTAADDPQDVLATNETTVAVPATACAAS
jgi:hypothetical protein